MRHIFILIFLGCLLSCSDSSLEEENAKLRSEVEEYKIMAMRAAEDAREAEARALMAMQEAENKARLAEQALKDCEGK